MAVLGPRNLLWRSQGGPVPSHGAEPELDSGDPEAEFILETVSESVVKVTHRNQVGWFGINVERDVLRPYSWTVSECEVMQGGVKGQLTGAWSPDVVIQPLCRALLDEQRKEDSKRVNPEDRKAAAKRVLHEFLNELRD